jgi:hypothetical protein
MVNAALKDTAMAAIRTKNTYLRALRTPALPNRARQSDRRRQALDARRRLARAHQRPALRRPRTRLLPPPQPTRTTKHLVAQLQALGHTVTLQEAAA